MRNQVLNVCLCFSLQSTFAAVFNITDQTAWDNYMTTNANNVPLKELIGSEQDCNDDPNAGGSYINPNATEVCDGIDNDRDGLKDDDDSSITGLQTWYEDADADGFGDPATSTLSCSQPNGYVLNSSDNCPMVFGLKLDLCDDGNPNTLGDFIKNNCECVFTQQIPALSQWSLIILGLCLSALGMVAVRQRVYAP